MYAVSFYFQLSDPSDQSYYDELSRLSQRAEAIPGFLGEHALRADNGRGLSISYWTSREAIQQWASDPAHKLAKINGRRSWYSWYDLKICHVEKVSSLNLPDEARLA